jgi:hypothetical protein
MEPPLCPACRAQLGNAPTETLIQIIAQLATYNQVALRLLAEGHEVVAHVRAGLRTEHKPHRKKSGGLPQTTDRLARSVD